MFVCYAGAQNELRGRVISEGRSPRVAREFSEYVSRHHPDLNVKTDFVGFYHQDSYPKLRECDFFVPVNETDGQGRMWAEMIKMDHSLGPHRRKVVLVGLLTSDEEQRDRGFEKLVRIIRGQESEADGPGVDSIRESLDDLMKTLKKKKKELGE